jgi:hypothetical protein
MCNSSSLSWLLHCRCKAHGGGRRCTHASGADGQPCPRSAQGSTGLCKRHGGGKRCAFKLCAKPVADVSAYCKQHIGQEVDTRPSANGIAHLQSQCGRESCRSGVPCKGELTTLCSWCTKKGLLEVGGGSGRADSGKAKGVLRPPPCASSSMGSPRLPPRMPRRRRSLGKALPPPVMLNFD